MDSQADGPTRRIRGSGCVCASIAIVNSWILVSGLGDCGVLLKRLSGWEDMLPRHWPEEKEEQQSIEKAGGQVHKNSISGILGVSRAFGDISYKESYYNMS